MSRNNLANAQAKKSNEFYTQYFDIETEMNAFLDYNPDVFRDKVILLPCDDPEWSNFTKYFAQNFIRLGLKKLISTSYALESKQIKLPVQLSFLELESPDYDPDKTNKCGKVFTLTKSSAAKVNINNLKWKYLKGDGDFRSEEVKKLRDESDIIITNPAFSLFREFLDWILEANKQFAIIGHQNAISYQEVFPLIKDNKIWLGQPFKGNVGFFKSPYEDFAVAGEHKEGLIRVSGVMWFTNIDLGRRHDFLQLMTMEDNIKFGKDPDLKKYGYQKYDNYDAIEVQYSVNIPSDYDGVMGVPLTFMDKYNPDQFEIVGIAKTPLGANLRTKIYGVQTQYSLDKHTQELKTSKVKKLNDGPSIKCDGIPDKLPYYQVGDDYYISKYVRILIKRR